MTGSGKTGLCLGLIEEAAIDGVPVIAIDPKGDLGNLLLTFPGLSAAEFRPWVNEDDARLAGLDVDAFAAKEAAGWAAGLHAWGQDGARIERLRKSAEFTIFTPGSRAGGRSRFSVPSARRRPRSVTTRSCWRSVPAAPRRAPWCWPASTLRRAAANTVSSPHC